MSVRSGAQFLEGLRSAPRQVWVAGRHITDSRPIPCSRGRCDDRHTLRPAVRAGASRGDDDWRDADGGEDYGTSFMTPRVTAIWSTAARHEGLGRGELRPARPLAGLPQHRADGLDRERRLVRPARRAIRRQRAQLLQAIAAIATCSPPTPSSIRRPTAPRARTSRTISSPISAWSRRPRTA